MPSPAPPVEAPLAEPPPRPRVLLVDDDPDILESFAPILEPYLGAGVDTACSAEEAQHAVARRAYRAVISDQRMPGLLGSQLLAWVEQAQPEARRVLMSAYDNALAGRPAEEGRPHLVLRKPFNFNEVLPALRDLLAGRLVP